MSAIAGWLLAWLLPTLAGSLFWCACVGRPRDLAAWCAAIGSGYLIGAIGLGATLAFFTGASSVSFMVAGAVFLVFVAAGTGLVLRRTSLPSLGADEAGIAGRRDARWLAPLTVALTLFALLLALQALLLPTLGWDAWNSWLAKSKAWFHNGMVGPSVSLEAWGQAPVGSAITALGWPYPEAVPRYALWLALGAGEWREGLVHFGWLGCWLALGLAMFGHLRLLRVRTGSAALATAGLLTLPMVTAHVALAGYADLWLAAMLMLAAFHAHRWLGNRRRGDAVVALACIALLPTIKAEGAVWLACVLAATALGRLRPRAAAIGLGAAALAWAVALPWGGLRFPLPGLGWVRLGWADVEMAKLGHIELKWQSVGTEVVQTLFLLPNWSLLWYVAPLVAWIGWRAIPGDPGLRMLTWFVVLGLGVLSVLFFFTDASAWAENFTSVNRVLMHVVPTLVAWLSLLWAGRARPGTARSTGA